MKISTKAVQLGLGADPNGAVSVPIYQTATFCHPSFGESTGFDYSRSGNPTRQVLEEGIATLDGGFRGFAYASGMSALTNLFLLFGPGDHLIVTEDLYGGTYRLLDTVMVRFGLEVTYIDTSDLQKLIGAIQKNTKAVLVESLTNPLLKLADIREISRIAGEHNILSIVDNTFLTPYLQRPLDLGADIVVYSASKYLSGHNDVVAGLLVVKDRQLAERVYFIQNSAGAVLGPQDSWLVIRGLKTLGVRLDRQVQNARSIAGWLKSHRAVRKVYYPGIGAMISFEVENKKTAEQIINSVRLVSFAESLGGVETLITFPAFQTHADLEKVDRERMGINDRLLRLSVGIEDIDDLISDLEQAFSGKEVS